MKIIFVIDSLGTGGAERSTAELWRYLLSRGVAVKILVLEKRALGIQNDVLNEKLDVEFLEGKAFVGQAWQIARKVRDTRPDLVHSVLLRSNLRTRLARCLTSFVHVESLVNCSYDPIRLTDPKVGFLSFYYYKWLDRLSSFLVDKFIAITETVRNHYTDVLGTSPKKISVVYRGRRENEFVSDRLQIRQKFLQSLNLSQDVTLLLHVGRQEFQKGHLVLLKALHAIEDRVPRPLAVVLLGRDGNASSAIKDYLKKNEIKIPVHWLGHRHDVPEWMAAADAFVFPSRYEGLGGVLIEAQAAGLPVICSDIPVLNEVVLRGANAIMFERDNETQLGESLLEFLNKSGDEIDRMRIASRENFRRKFTIDTVHRQMFDLYEALL